MKVSNDKLSHPQGKYST